MEMWRSPEVLRPGYEFRPELQPERDLCLDSLLAQAEGREHSDYDADADKYLIESLNNAVTEVDADTGTFVMSCQQPGCEVSRVLLERTNGANGTLKVVIDDRRDLDDCLLK